MWFEGCQVRLYNTRIGTSRSRKGWDVLACTVPNHLDCCSHCSIPQPGHRNSFASRFLRLKRSFHHQLILMLILSHSFKALWLFVSPIVDFSCGNCGHVETPSPFSQASGLSARDRDRRRKSLYSIHRYALDALHLPPCRGFG